MGALVKMNSISMRCDRFLLILFRKKLRRENKSANNISSVHCLCNDLLFPLTSFDSFSSSASNTRFHWGLFQEIVFTIHGQRFLDHYLLLNETRWCLPPLFTSSIIVKLESRRPVFKPDAKNKLPWVVKRNFYLRCLQFLDVEITARFKFQPIHFFFVF